MNGLAWRHTNVIAIWAYRIQIDQRKEMVGFQCERAEINGAASTIALIAGIAVETTGTSGHQIRL